MTFKLGNLSFPVSKNKLFLDIKLTSCASNYQFQLLNVGQLDRCMVCTGDNLNYHYQPSYSHDVVGSINLNITDLIPNDYCFNPQDLFEINEPSDLASTGWTYTSFPKLQFSVNQFLLTRCYDANLIAQLVDAINSFATATNNQKLLNLNQEL